VHTSWFSGAEAVDRSTVRARARDRGGRPPEAPAAQGRRRVCVSSVCPAAFARSGALIPSSSRRRRACAASPGETVSWHSAESRP